VIQLNSNQNSKKYNFDINTYILEELAFMLIPNVCKSLGLVLPIKSYKPEEICLIFEKEGNT